MLSVVAFDGLLTKTDGGKNLLMPVFISIFVLVSVAAKQKAWLCLCGSFGGGMLLFMTVGMITPLSATAINAALCLTGSTLFCLPFSLAAKNRPEQDQSGVTRQNPL